MLDLFDDRSESAKVDHLCKTLREKDKNLRRRNQIDEKRLTYWDADDFSLFHGDIVVGLVQSHLLPGKTIWVSAKRPAKEGGICLSAKEMVEMQFATGDMFVAISMVEEVFGVDQIQGENEALAEIKRYNEKMDELIVEAAKNLKDHKVRDVFEKLVDTAVGVGREPRSDDRFGRRLVYFRELLRRYRANKSKYRPLLQGHGLLEKKA